MSNAVWAKSRHFLFYVCGENVRILLRDLSKLDSLKIRRREVVRVLRRRLGKIGEVLSIEMDPEIIVEICPYVDAACCHKLIERLDDRIGEIMSRPLHPKLLQSLLGISSQERLRWTKDGRLPRSRNINFRRGRVVSIASYPIDVALEISNNPSVVEGWRRCDCEKGLF
ncbi:hypothetical protein [Magnetospirillum fulvum]|uniref:hypothetical protein n=1 Tax=Magnetospirillum fulvum TaxID=1082 RepID=UPI0011153FA9|nr:hypothetical protein [Magnetospirillum fulvum]